MLMDYLCFIVKTLKYFRYTYKLIMTTYTLDVDHRTHCGLDLNVTGSLLIQILIRIGESKGTMSDNSEISWPFTCLCFPN